MKTPSGNDTFNNLVISYERKLSTLLGQPIEISYELLNGATIYVADSTAKKVGFSGGTIRFRLANPPHPIGHFALGYMPGCCGVLVLFHMWLAEPYRNKGVATLLAQMKLDLAKFFGYVTLLCTDVVNNEPERKLLAKGGWKDIHTFTNPRTENVVAISLLDISEPAVEAPNADH